MKDERPMLERSLVIPEGLGLHARVATMMVRAMQNYASDVTLTKDNIVVSARSVLGLLLLAASPGTKILLRAEGPDSIEALDEICRLIQDDRSEEN
jgi:phosphocarrier protein